jgi:hypothetical protein
LESEVRDVGIQVDGGNVIDEWERSDFAMTVAELEIHEALMAISRLLDGEDIGPLARRALARAAYTLRTEARIRS